MAGIKECLISNIPSHFHFNHLFLVHFHIQLTMSLLDSPNDSFGELEKDSTGLCLTPLNERESCVFDSAHVSAHSTPQRRTKSQTDHHEHDSYESGSCKKTPSDIFSEELHKKYQWLASEHEETIQKYNEKVRSIVSQYEKRLNWKEKQLETLKEKNEHLEKMINRNFKPKIENMKKKINFLELKIGSDEGKAENVREENEKKRIGLGKDMKKLLMHKETEAKESWEKLEGKLKKYERKLQKKEGKIEKLKEKLKRRENQETPPSSSLEHLGIHKKHSATYRAQLSSSLDHSIEKIKETKVGRKHEKNSKKLGEEQKNLRKRSMDGMEEESSKSIQVPRKKRPKEKEDAKTQMEVEEGTKKKKKETNGKMDEEVVKKRKYKKNKNNSKEIDSIGNNENINEEAKGANPNVSVENELDSLNGMGAEIKAKPRVGRPKGSKNKKKDSKELENSGQMILETPIKMAENNMKSHSEESKEIKSHFPHEKERMAIESDQQRPSFSQKESKSEGHKTKEATPDRLSLKDEKSYSNEAEKHIIQEPKTSKQVSETISAQDSSFNESGRIGNSRGFKKTPSPNMNIDQGIEKLLETPLTPESLLKKEPVEMIEEFFEKGFMAFLAYFTENGIPQNEVFLLKATLALFPQITENIHEIFSPMAIDTSKTFDALLRFTSRHSNKSHALGGYFYLLINTLPNELFPGLFVDVSRHILQNLWAIIGQLGPNSGIPKCFRFLEVNEKKYFDLFLSLIHPFFNERSYLTRTEIAGKLTSGSLCDSFDPLRQAPQFVLLLFFALQVGRRYDLDPFLYEFWEKSVLVFKGMKKKSEVYLDLTMILVSCYPYWDKRRYCRRIGMREGERLTGAAYFTQTKCHFDAIMKAVSCHFSEAGLSQETMNSCKETTGDFKGSKPSGFLKQQGPVSSEIIIKSLNCEKQLFFELLCLGTLAVLHEASLNALVMGELIKHQVILNWIIRFIMEDDKSELAVTVQKFVKVQNVSCLTLEKKSELFLQKQIKGLNDPKKFYYMMMHLTSQLEKKIYSHEEINKAGAVSLNHCFCDFFLSVNMASQSSSGCPEVINEFWEGFSKNEKYKGSWQRILTEKALE